MQSTSIKEEINSLFKQNGISTVSRFGYRFNDGCLFEKFYNLYFGENVNCKLKANCLDTTDKQLNWVKINNIIFNKYCNAEISISESEIIALAKGRNEDAIISLLEKFYAYAEGRKGVATKNKEIRKSVK